MDNVNEYLQSLDAPIANNQGAVPAYQFSNTNERNSVNLTRIKNFNFSSGTGGTLTLGGANNGNGLMLIKDSGGTTIVQADNAGITIYGGNIVVKNTNNTTIIDTNGIVSTNSFIYGQLQNASSPSTTSTSYVDVTGSSLSPLVLTRTTNAYIYFTISGYTDTVGVPNDYFLNVAFVDNGTVLQDVYTSGERITIVSGGVPSYYVNDEFVNQTQLYPFTAGTHNLKLQMRVDNGDGTVRASLLNWSIGYMVFGA